MTVFSLQLFGLVAFLGVRGYWTSDSWELFLLHPDRDGGWFRGYGVFSTGGRFELAAHTEFAGDSEFRVWRGDLPPVLSHNFQDGNISQPGGGLMKIIDRFGFYYGREMGWLEPLASAHMPNSQWTRLWGVPFWLSALLGVPGLVGLAQVVRMKLRRRAVLRGHCGHCGYDLRGSDARCPECGTLRGTETRTFAGARAVLMIAVAGPLLLGSLAFGAFKVIEHQQSHVRSQYVASEDLRRIMTEHDFSGPVGQDATDAMLDALQRGADPTAFRCEALLSAINHRYVRVLREMIRRCVDLNVNIPEGMSALTRAINIGDVELVRLLLTAGADANLRVHIIGGSDGDSPLQVLVRAGDAASITEQTQCEMAKLLLAYHADVNAQDGQGSTALLLAAERNLYGLIRILLAAGAEVSAVHEHGDPRLPDDCPADIRNMLTPKAQSNVTKHADD